MSEALQLRRGTATQIAAFTGAAGEVVVDTTNNRLVLQDGVTAGGFSLAKLAEVTAISGGRRAISDAATTALATDRFIAYTAITAPRVVSLLAASAFPTGAVLGVIDESGAVSATNTITVSRSGGDTINSGTAAVISVAHGYIFLESDGVSRWSVVAIDVGDMLGSTLPSNVTASSLTSLGTLSSATVAGDVMIGNNTPTAPLTITPQTTTLPTPAAGALAHFIGANGAPSRVQWNSYGSNGSFLFYRADGSLGSETALASGDAIGAIAFRGFNGSAYSGSAATLTAAAVGTWSGSNTGTVLSFGTTPQGSTTLAVAMSIYAGVVIGTGTTDPGAGNLAVGGTISANVGTLAALNVSGQVALSSTTASTSPTTGGLTIPGGVGVGGALNVGGAISTPTPAVGTNTTQVATTAFVYSNPTVGFRNRLANGAIAIDQRNSGAAQTIVAGAALAYTVDRFYAYSTGANVTGQRVANAGVSGASSQYAYQFTGAASVTAIGFGQRIEAANSFDLAGTTATLSVNLANSLLTTVTWTAYYATTADTFGTLASPTRTSIATGTFTVNSTMTRYSAQIVMPSGATTGVEIVLSVGAQISGTWQIGDVQLEASSVATVFERVPVGLELVRAQRYFQQMTPTNSGSLGCYAYTISGAYTNTYYLLPQTMRVTPTITVLGTWTTAYTSATGVSADGPSNFHIFAQASATNAIYYINPANGGLSFSAEL